MKKTFLLALLAFAGYTTHAQTQGAVQKLGIGAEVVLPVSQGSSGVLGLGASLKYEHPIAPALNFTLSGGYVNLFSTERGASESLNLIPLKAGAKYYFGKGFYGATELGASILSGDGESVTAFTFAPGLGVSLASKSKNNVDIGLRYENLSANGGSLSLLGLRIGYNFGL
ncbi:hypothetical protein VRU48_07765 [Pedobacter sp. KR3-3]|uniref:Outer membrane protein beta-barrel domain-containing protein n=1 Tax=Pedobacter albus TaxID=3113905 RepID=A0ABU7I690_9SPHI|nr:hypothetical protein [Pedobacter sp. KR3-3]MEE1944998.1 hypothetical protein [Pedobacter sp. KR3-3]